MAVRSSRSPSPREASIPTWLVALLRFSQWSTAGWAAALVGTAWLTREVRFVLDAAFSLRGLTSGALLGGLILALFARGVGARAAMTGMIASFAVMNFVYWPANLPATREWWWRTFGGEIFWPWFTLLGTLLTLGMAALMSSANRAPR